MSLPPAHKDISIHPAPDSVTAPVDQRDKDKDVERKLRFYGVIEAFRKGRMPSNQQIDHTLKYVLDHSPVDTEKLSPDGRKLISDMRDIIDTAHRIVMDKNADELFQYFIWHTRDVEREALAPGDLSPVKGEKAKKDRDQAVRHLRTLLRLILTNSEIRKLLSDFSIIGRDLLAKGTHKIAGVIAPKGEELAHVDESTPGDRFVSEGGRPVGPNAAPVLDVNIPGTDALVKEHPQKGAVVQGTSGKQRDVQDVGREKVDEVKSQAKVSKDEAKGKIRDQAQEKKETAISAEEGEKKKKGLIEKMKGVRDNVLDRIPSEHKDKAQTHFERGKKFLTEEYFPEERRDQFIFRGKKVIIECQKHDDYQESMSWLLDLIEEYAKHGRKAAKGSVDGTKNAFITDAKLKRAIDELRTLLERFANNTSLNLVIDAMDALIDDAYKDEGLRHWFQDVNVYARQVLLEPGYVLEDQCNKDAERLRESGREFYDVKYKDHFNDLFSSTGTWFKEMGEDPLNKRFGEDWARLTKDLLFDSEGSLAFKSELWQDVRKVILPEIVDMVGYIPIPRIEYSDESLDLVVENLTLSGRNLFPNIISIEAHNFFKFSPYDAIPDEHHHRFTFTLDQMQADIRDVAFYFRKKTGIPKMSDSGLADVILGGNGLHASIVLVSANKKDKSSIFKVHDVQVKMESLKFSIRDSKHDLLYKTLKPLATALVKRQISRVVADALRTGFEYMDGQLVSVRDRMETAKATEGQSRTQVLKDMFKRKSGTEEHAEPSESHFKVVVDKRNSILSLEGHPAGWVNRMAEKETIAEHGTEWRSDAFTIV
ncbi:hypothetical protein APHAL10511_003148 [Amanita phalloides]|nr:hypothetical protein APHAL10511_003148 [Amanita phalloides]